MKVRTQPVSTTETEIDSPTQTPVVTPTTQPHVDKKSRDQVLGEIAGDCLISPQEYLRDSVACTGE